MDKAKHDKILKLLSEGLSTSQIKERIGVNADTIRKIARGKKTLSSEENRARQAAQKIGCTPEEYLAQRQAGMRWCSYHPPEKEGDRMGGWRPEDEVKAGLSQCIRCGGRRNRGLSRSGETGSV